MDYKQELIKRLDSATPQKVAAMARLLDDDNDELILEFATVDEISHELRKRLNTRFLMIVWSDDKKDWVITGSPDITAAECTAICAEATLGAAEIVRQSLNGN